MRGMHDTMSLASRCPSCTTSSAHRPEEHGVPEGVGPTLASHPCIQRLVRRQEPHGDVDGPIRAAGVRPVNLLWRAQGEPGETISVHGLLLHCLNHMRACRPVPQPSSKKAALCNHASHGIPGSRSCTALPHQSQASTLAWRIRTQPEGMAQDISPIKPPPAHLAQEGHNHIKSQAPPTQSCPLSDPP